MITATPGSEIIGADIDANFAECVIKTGNQTIAGVKTFTSVPILTATPTADGEVTHKLYVDKGSLLTGDLLIASADTERESSDANYTKYKEIQVFRTGTYRVKFDLKSNFGIVTAYGKIYKNSGAVGTERTTTSAVYTTYSEDLSFTAGDLVQLYQHCSNAGDVRNFRLYVAGFDKIIVAQD